MTNLELLFKILDSAAVLVALAAFGYVIAQRRNKKRAPLSAAFLRLFFFGAWASKAFTWNEPDSVFWWMLAALAATYLLGFWCALIECVIDSVSFKESFFDSVNTQNDHDDGKDKAHNA